MHAITNCCIQKSAQSVQSINAMNKIISYISVFIFEKVICMECPRVKRNIGNHMCVTYIGRFTSFACIFFFISKILQSKYEIVNMWKNTTINVSTINLYSFDVILISMLEIAQKIKWLQLTATTTARMMSNPKILFELAIKVQLINECFYCKWKQKLPAPNPNKADRQTS